MANKGLLRKRQTFVEIFGKISERVVNRAFRGVNVNETERSVGKRRTSKRDEFGGLTIYIYFVRNSGKSRETGTTMVEKC